jgi:hypothetical protein
MTTEILKDFFMWCSILNIVFLTIMWLLFWLGRSWIYRIHTKWLKLSDQQFDALWYGIFAFYKISIFLFNIVPFIALVIVG